MTTAADAAVDAPPRRGECCPVADGGLVQPCGACTPP